MKAAYLVRYGTASQAFEIRETEIPTPSPSQILIQVEGFGLNFADVMARLGLYKGAPPNPAILGYDVVGRVAKCGTDVVDFEQGDRVIALTRFGGYAEYALAEGFVSQRVPEDLPPGEAVALSTQYCTAYFLSHLMANLQQKDRVLIHAAAGGVGTALVQMAKAKNCIIFGTCGSAEKIAYLEQAGVQHPINYRKEDFVEVVRKVSSGHGLDVVFDPIGGKSVKQGFKLLGAGGRILSYGLSSMNQTSNIFGKLKVLGQFGFYHPVQFLSGSRGMIGVNMLKVADDNPRKIAYAMQKVIEMTSQGILKPFVGGEFSINQLVEAHEYLESRKSMGKIVVKW
ncbi:MAG: zinc-binding dehydrogenase [Saprospiraceae bacterium]|nr:zinc-binding dehydrogenase [Saprospiraceae bacterium]